MKNIFKITIIYFCLTCFANNIYASTVSFGEEKRSLGIGDEFLLPIFIDGDKDNINAISGDMLFSDNTLFIKKIITANSVISFWVEKPRVSGSSVTFSGIIPGGYKNVIDPVTNIENKGLLFTLDIKVIKQGEGKIFFDEFHSYLNDGLATEVKTNLSDFIINLSKDNFNIKNNVIDKNPPLGFIPSLMNSKNIYGDKNMLVFYATDKETGIDHYEVKQGDGDWVRAESPYLLSDQSLNGIISVKAVDQAGNYRIASINSKNKSSIFGYILNILGLLFIIIFCYNIYIKYGKRARRKN